MIASVHSFRESNWILLLASKYFLWLMNVMKEKREEMRFISETHQSNGEEEASLNFGARFAVFKWSRVDLCVFIRTKRMKKYSLVEWQSEMITWGKGDEREAMFHSCKMKHMLLAQWDREYWWRCSNSTRYVESLWTHLFHTRGHMLHRVDRYNGWLSRRQWLLTSSTSEDPFHAGVT